MRIDLHTHSACSDGTDTPAELIAAAIDAGLDVVALTDHDTVDGWKEATDAAARLGIEVLLGEEITCLHEGSQIHMLALGHDPTSPQVAGNRTRLIESRKLRAQRIVERLGADFDISWAEVQRRVPDGATIGRPAIADALVAKGYFDKRDDAFAEVLAEEGPYNEPVAAPTPAECVAAIRAAGGLPIIAHPLAPERGGGVFDIELLGPLAAEGLFGVEVFHPSHNDEQRERLLAACDRDGLIPTGGSDYHGTGKTNRLGDGLTPEELFAAISDALDRRG